MKKKEKKRKRNEECTKKYISSMQKYQKLITLSIDFNEHMNICPYNINNSEQNRKSYHVSRCHVIEHLKWSLLNAFFYFFSTFYQIFFALVLLD